MTRTRRNLLALVVTAAAAAGAVAGSSAVESAAPIVCPGNQTVTKTGPGTWACTTPTGNDTGAGWHQGNHNKL